MDAERIVRALAAANPADYDPPHECGLCDQQVWDYGPLERPNLDQIVLGLHKPDCPWRLAREWVADHPA